METFFNCTGSGSYTASLKSAANSLNPGSTLERCMIFSVWVSRSIRGRILEIGIEIGGKRHSWFLAQGKNMRRYPKRGCVTIHKRAYGASNDK